jgi:hypothetical protein
MTARRRPHHLRRPDLLGPADPEVLKGERSGGHQQHREREHAPAFQPAARLQPHGHPLPQSKPRPFSPHGRPTGSRTIANNTTLSAKSRLGVGVGEQCVTAVNSGTGIERGTATDSATATDYGTGTRTRTGTNASTGQSTSTARARDGSAFALSPACTVSPAFTLYLAHLVLAHLGIRVHLGRPGARAQLPVPPSSRAHAWPRLRPHSRSHIPTAASSAASTASTPAITTATATAPHTIAKRTRRRVPVHVPLPAGPFGEQRLRAAQVFLRRGLAVPVSASAAAW